MQEDEVLVETVRPAAADPFGNPVDGAECRLRNGRGEWRIVTPAIVRVARSSQPIEFECTKDGYATAHGTATCTRLAQIERTSQALAALQLLGLIPYAALAAPVAPEAAAVAAGQGAIAGAAIVEGSAHATREADTCVYRRVTIELRAHLR